MTTGQPTLAGGRYALGEVIGRGGMADVYRGRDEVLGRTVAVKWLRSAGGDADATGADARTRAEGRLLAGLSHPGLVTVFDAGVEADRPFIVMELIHGASLGAWRGEGRLEPVTVADIGAQLAETLAYVHGQGLIHRDIKPGNVLLDGAAPSPGRVRLADFGIARLVDATQLTATGLTVGTAAYLAPEQVRGEVISSAVDIYALGLVLLECFTGEREYVGAPVEAAVARLSRPPRLPDWLPAEWRQLLLSMTASDPAARPEAGVVAGWLRAAAAVGSDAPTLVAEGIRPPLPATERLPIPVPLVSSAPWPKTAGSQWLVRRTRWVLAGLLALAAIVVVLVVVSHGGSRGQPASPAVSPLPVPSVSGQLGRDLTDLHHAVNP